MIHGVLNDTEMPMQDDVNKLNNNLRKSALLTITLSKMLT